MGSVNVCFVLIHWVSRCALSFPRCEKKDCSSSCIMALLTPATITDGTQFPISTCLWEFQRTRPSEILPRGCLYFPHTPFTSSPPDRRERERERLPSFPLLLHPANASVLYAVLLPHTHTRRGELPNPVCRPRRRRRTPGRRSVPRNEAFFFLTNAHIWLLHAEPGRNCCCVWKVKEERYAR